MKTRFLSLGLWTIMSAILLCPFPVVAQRVVDKDVADFDRIEFVGRGEVTLRQGTNPHVQLEASDDDDLRRFRTETRGNTLRIIYDDDDENWLDLAPKIRATITYPELRELRLTGLVKLTSPDKISNDRFSLEIEGMGNVQLNLEVESLDIASAGTANIDLSGRANDVEIVNDGTGTIDAFDLLSQDADVEVNGTGLIRINSQQSLRAEANGFGATVRYLGNPKDTYFDTSGFASIKADK